MGILRLQVLGLRHPDRGTIDVEQVIEHSRLELDEGPRWWTEQGRMAGSKRIPGQAWEGVDLETRS